jgi:CRISPR-associated protein Cas5h
MNQNILKLLSFRVSGKFAHFRKFYTNASSLSYMIPPRTVLIGMLASVLRYERNSYYEVFHPENFRISAAVTPGTRIKKKMQSMNYLHFKYHNLLCRGTGEGKNMHAQCKLELLMPESKAIDYTIYLGVVAEESKKLLDDLEDRIRRRNFGYGIYLGQRQFRADISHIRSYPAEAIRFMKTAEYTDALCIQENGEPDMAHEENLYTHMVIDQMPVHMKKEKHVDKKKTKGDPGRVIHTVKRVLYEKFGKRIFGKFKNGYQIEDKVITFYEG